MGIKISGNIKLTGKLKSIVKWIMLILTILIIAGIKMEIKIKKEIYGHVIDATKTFPPSLFSPCHFVIQYLRGLNRPFFTLNNNF